MTPITIKPMLDIVKFLGLQPVFIDIERDTLNIDLDDLKKKINNQTKVILITHLFGIVPDMNKIIKILRKNKIFIIEDFSHSFNASFGKKKIGTFGDVGIYSMSSIKSLDTFGGAFLISKNSKIVNIINMLQKKLIKGIDNFEIFKKIIINIARNIATSSVVFNFFIFYILKITKFKKIDKSKMLGDRFSNTFNQVPRKWLIKYSSLQAEVGLKKLKNINRDDKKRIYLAKKLHKIFIEKKIQHPGVYLNKAKNVYWQFLIYQNNPFVFEKYLMKYGIDCTSTSLKFLPDESSNLKYQKLRKSKSIYEDGIFIPCHSYFTKSQIKKLLEVLEKKL